MISIKFRFDGENRRVSISDEASLEDVISLAKTLFGSVLEDREFCFKYRDDEGDIISISSTLELKEAIRIAKLIEIESPVIKFVIIATPKEVKSEDVVHHAICDGCEQNIKGIRYKCLNCPDYDLCSSCIQSKEKIHPEHEFASITRPLAFPFGIPRGLVFGCPRFNGHCRRRCNPNVDNTATQSMENPKGNEESKEVEPKSGKEEKEQIPVKIPESPRVDVSPVTSSVPFAAVTSPSSLPSSPVPSPKQETQKVEKQVSPFELKVQQLEEMGFSNRALNIQLLIQTKGDIIQVVKKLLDL